MTRALILGGGGMIGQKLARRIAAEHPDWLMTLHDLAFPVEGAPGAQRIGDVSLPHTMQALAAEKFDVIFHLASVVSGQAEAEFDTGWRVNLWPMWHLMEALRAQHVASGQAYRPRVVFTSSIAVFGGPFPDVIGDDFAPSPLTSYGAQKLACEVLLQDYTRKGFVDGISLRLPTICVRPGAPNAAASGFFSGIIREPMNGQEALLPVGRDVTAWHASPRSAAGFLLHAAGLDGADIGPHR
ncbi:MAG: NAD-dependent epimerase/dehydratase family protein, partial [Shimia sp.]